MLNHEVRFRREFALTNEQLLHQGMIKICQMAHYERNLLKSMTFI